MSNHAASCACATGYVPNPTVADGCVSCTDNSHCSNGQTCTNNQCSCSGDSDCTDTQTCTSGVCTEVSCNLTCGSNAQCEVANHAASCQCKTGFYPNTNPLQGCDECTDDSHCTNGQSCQSNACVTTCSQDSDCSDTQSCTNGGCQDVSCNLTCGANAECTVSSHTASCECASGFQPNPDVATGCAICTDDSHCSGGQTCVSDICVTVCSTNTDCADNESCESGQCAEVKNFSCIDFEFINPEV